MARLYATISSTVGVFSGYMKSDKETTAADLDDVVTALMENVNSIEYLALESITGERILFTKNILASSVFTFRIEE